MVDAVSGSSSAGKSSSSSKSSEGTSNSKSETKTEAVANSPTTEEVLSGKSSAEDRDKGGKSEDSKTTESKTSINKSLEGVTSSRSSGDDAKTPTDLAANDGSANSLEDVALAGAQGLTALAAREGMGSEQARNSYNEKAAQLDPSDTQGRRDLKANTRADTPPIVRTVIESVRPDTGPRPGTSGNATHTNKGANQLASNLGKLGKGNAVVGATLGVAKVAYADNKVEETAKVGGGVLGGIGGGALVGTQLGAMGANPVTVIGGAVLGGIVGGIAGEAVVSKATDWVKSFF